MKVYFSVILVFIFFLTACGGSTSTSQPVEEVPVVEATATQIVPTNTPEPTPTIPPTPAPGEVLYETDNFKDLNEAWEIFSRSEDPYTVERHADGLFFEIPNIDQAVYAIYQSIDQSDVQIDMTAQKLEGPNLILVGLVCRYSENGRYVFTITTGGQWTAILFETGTFPALLGEGSHKAIQTNKNINHVRLICKGDTFRFIVNDVEIGSFTNDRLVSGTTGMIITSGQLGGPQMKIQDYIIRLPE